MGGKGSAPKAPDYVGAAQEQAAASREATMTQNFANRPVINTPFGSQTWGTQAVTDPATGQPVTQWTQNTTLAPDLQAALDAQVASQRQRSEMAGDFMSRVQNEYGTPFDWQNLPQMAQLGSASQLGTGLSDYTPGLQTDVNARTGNISSGFGIGGPQMGVDAMTGGLRTNVEQTPVVASLDSMQGGVQRGVQNFGVNAQFNPMTGDMSRMTQNEALQRGLRTADNPALPQFDSGYRDTVARSLMERMVPVHERQQNQLETQLANQGFTIGSQGYKRAMDELQQRQSQERYNALDTAGQEAQRLFNMGMGARQQAFQEDVTGGQFVNQAAGQAFQQGLAGNQFRNQATQQAFNQAMAAQQAGNQAIGQQFQQGLAAGQFGNQATQQAFNQAQAANQAFNQAQAQRFQQGLAANQFTNQALGQGYQQNLGAAQFGNQAQQQLFGQLMGQTELGNRAAAQQFQQDLASQQFRNQALGQASALDIARMQAQNQALSQQQGLNQQFADQQNRLRQQAIAEQQLRRGMSLNEMNALLSGQQVSMPQMPSFVSAGRSETPNILGATQMGYDAQLGAYNAQQAAGANMLGGLFSLGSAALGNPYGLFGLGGR